jgi:hypothetical protein
LSTLSVGAALLIDAPLPDQRIGEGIRLVLLDGMNDGSAELVGGRAAKMANSHTNLLEVLCAISSGYSGYRGGRIPCLSILLGADEAGESLRLDFFGAKLYCPSGEFVGSPSGEFVGRPRVTLHEDLTRRVEVRKPGERNFGIALATLLALVGAFKLYALGGHAGSGANGESAGGIWHAGGEAASAGIYWLSAAMAVLAFALLWPAPLRPLNAGWHRFGLLAAKVMNPLVMSVVFFAVITPVGLLLRLCGKDSLRLAIDRSAPSYWLERKPSGGDGQQMKNQF